MRTKKGTALNYRTLRASFTRAIELGYIKEKPFVKVRPSKMEKSSPIFITECELEIIIECTPNTIL